MSLPLLSLTWVTWGATRIAARWVVAVRFGARTAGFQEMYHRFEFSFW
jgi:hypothetical protein